MEGTSERRNQGGTKALGHGGVGGMGRTAHCMKRGVPISLPLMGREGRITRAITKFDGDGGGDQRVEYWTYSFTNNFFY